MVDRILKGMNGHGAMFIRVFYEIVVVLVVLWMFTQVRDFPVVYLTRADAQTLKEELRCEFSRLNTKLDDIERYLRRQQ